MGHFGHDDLYELDHGFKLNNFYLHNRKMLGTDNQWDITLRGLKTRDPRLTRSATDLMAIYYDEDED